MATSIRNQSLELIDLPTEVLVEIFNHLPEKDISTVRLVCKKLCDAATPRFAKVNFTERIHVVSPYSIDKLVSIAEHPIYGQCVKVVSIASARRIKKTEDPDWLWAFTTNEKNRGLYFNAYVKTGRFSRRMERVSRNLRSRSGPIAIRICDNTGIGDSAEVGLFGHEVPKRCCGWMQLYQSPSTHIGYQTVETLEQTIYAARRARCPVNSLTIDLFTTHTYDTRARLDAAMHKVLESSLTPLSIYLGGGRSHRLSYDSESQCLELEDADFGARSKKMTNVPVQGSYTWLRTQIITRFKIAKSSDFVIDHLRPFFTPYLKHLFTPHLKHLELSMVSVWTKHFNQNFWSEHIEMMSELSSLQHFKLSCLEYSFETTWDDDDDDQERYIDLSGHGRVFCPGNAFYLTSRDGCRSVEINAGHVCDKLKDLACYAAAAEARKLEDMISDRRVYNFTVGLIDGAEPMILDHQ
ncbi:hypothetical protein KCU85_g2795, partial [Aureobasidium melanogenum]